MRVDDSPHAGIEPLQIGLTALAHLVDSGQVADQDTVAQHILQQRLDLGDVLPLKRSLQSRLGWMAQQDALHIPWVIIGEAQQVRRGLTPVIVHAPDALIPWV